MQLRRFTTGPGSAIVGRSFVALVDASLDDPLCGALSDLLATEESVVREVLEQLRASAFETLPSFGVACADGSSGVAFVRGGVELVAPTGTVSGEGLLTWSEQRLVDDSAVILRFTGAESVLGPGRIALGAVSASAIEWAPTDDRIAADALATVAVPVVGVPAVDQGADVFAPGPPSDAPAPDPAPDTGVTEVQTDDDAVQLEAAPLDPAVDLSEIPVPAPSDIGALAPVASGVDVSVPPPAPDLALAPPAPPALPVPPPPAAPSPGPGRYDELFGATVARSIEEAAVREPAVEPEPASFIDSAPVSELAPVVDESHTIGFEGDFDAALDDHDPDHDGNTTSLAALRSAVESAGADLAASPEPDSYVTAVLCPSGHPNPPFTASCRVCGMSLVDLPTALVEQPAVGVFVLPSGERVPVDRLILVGRRPEHHAPVGGRPPRVVAFEQEQEVSRNHLQVSVDGWNVSVVDTDSKYGTVVRLPGQDAMAMQPRVPVTIVPGTDVVLADFVTLRFELA